VTAQSDPPADPRPATTDSEPSTGDRFKWMMKNSKRLIVALVLLLLAVVVFSISFAFFTTSEASPEVTVTAGQMAIEGEESVSFVAEALVPGESTTGAATISNDGDADGFFTLEISEITDTPETPALSDALELTVVEDPGVTDTEVYSGPVSGLLDTPTDLPGDGTGTRWEEDESHEYEFTVLFQETGQDQSALQGSSTAVIFTWNAQDDPVGA